jgi:hypothetical protein
VYLVSPSILRLHSTRSSAVKDPNVRIPAAFSVTLKSSKTLNLFTTLQPNTGGRTHFWPRGEHGLCALEIATHVRILQRKCLVVVSPFVYIYSLLLSTLFRHLYQRTGVSACNIELGSC